jgi:PrtD family type I secretion system ABC transporter
MQQSLPGQQQPPSMMKETLQKTRKAFLYVGLFSMFINILTLFVPLYSLQVLDRVLSSHSIETLWMLTIVTLAMFVFLSLFQAVRSLILSRVADWYENQLNEKVIGIMISKAASGQPASAGQAMRDLTSIKSFIAGSGLSSLFDAPWAVIFLAVVYMINPIIGWITLAGAVILFFFALFTELTTKKLLEQANRISLGSINSADAASRNAEAIESMGMLGHILSGWKENHRRAQDLHNQVNNRSNMLLAISRFFRLALQVAVTGVGAYLTLQHQMTAGGMIAASILSSRALAPFEAVIGIWKSLITTREAYHRLEQGTQVNVTFRGEMELPAPKGQIVAEGVFYRPANMDKPIIRGMSFQIMPGELVGIIGPSAAGKSTLAKLLIGILPPTVGHVRLDGADISQWNRDMLGPHVGYLPQDVELFVGTIRDNIARMSPDADDAKIIEAAQLANVHEMILRQPKGYETVISPGNQSLSPGQRQRVGLARAFYGMPKVLVLDEPNSNLDQEGERALVEALNHAKQLGMTVVVIAHRPSIILNADKILAMRDGLVERFGPRDEVLPHYVPGLRPQQPAVTQ